MEAVERIRMAEESLNRATAAIRRLEEALDIYERAREDIMAVDRYYGSSDWFRDLEDYDSGKLGVTPKELPAGILSEDAAYDMLTDNREICLRMAEISGKRLEEEA